MRGSTAGLAEGTIVTPVTVHAAFLAFLDIMFASTIAAPFVVTYWRGTWNMMDLLIFPDNKLYSAISSVLIGNVGHFIFYYYQGKFTKTFHPDKHRITYLIISRMYTYIYGIVCVNGWRGGWILMEKFVPFEAIYYFMILVVSFIILVWMKALRNVCASPFTISTDHSHNYFRIPTMFKASPETKPTFFFVDCLFSVLVVGTLVLFVWRSMFALSDLLIYPDDLHYSAYYSVAIGYAIIAVSFALQPMMKFICERLQGRRRVTCVDIFLFTSFLGTVNVWRSLWLLLDLDFMPDQEFLSNIITHAAGFLVLVMLNCSNSVLVRGIYVDAEEPGGQCVVFPIFYVRLFFQKERLKKQQKLRDAEKGEQQTVLLDKIENSQPQIVQNVNGKEKVGT